jgi:hypothetical protein
MRGIGERRRQNSEIKYAEPKYNINPAIVTPAASVRLILPLGSSRPAVRGFIPSILRSMILLSAKAAVRAPVAAARTRRRISHEGIDPPDPSRTPL